jgi:type VI secretion system secreted protein Hcp
MAVDMFLKLADIKGEAADGKDNKGPHAGEIEVLAWSWGMSQSASSHSGTGGGSGKVNVQDVSFTKKVDLATPNLLKFCCTGKHFPDATLTVRKAGDNPVEYLVLKMSKVIISSVSTGGSAGGDVLTENVSLNFAAFDIIYTSQTSAGAKDKTINGAFDIAGNAAK